MPFFSRVFKGKDAPSKKTIAPISNGKTTSKPQWSDAWLQTRVDPEDVAELVRGCTIELKSRALNVPFLLLPFRPASDPSAAKHFVRNYLLPVDGREPLRGTALISELKLADVMVLISVLKWCWARLPGGVVGWETYEGFKVGERDAHYPRDAFTTFVPIGIESEARLSIINDFFELLAAIAAHGKSNGLGGYKLSRYAGWWGFDHYDSGKGFEAGYKSWAMAADATCHLFFAYLRSLSPQSGRSKGILGLPLSLQQLLDATDYPPSESLLSNQTTKVVMIVDVVSPTPYALLRRAKNFEYRDDDAALQQFASYDDPVEALTDECRRVLKAISNTNKSNASNGKTSMGLLDPSWSRFEDLGFSSIDEHDEDGGFVTSNRANPRSISNAPRSPVTDLGRPTTPSWADFLSGGFNDEQSRKTPVLLPPDKMLPPINTTARGQSSQSHRRNLDPNHNLEPAELASINRVDVDDAFWWVWISSLAAEEPMSRKAVFGRCALIETVLPYGRWMVMEEQVKGAAPEPAAGAYVAEKKNSFLGFTKRGKLTRRRSGVKKGPTSPDPSGKNDFDPRTRVTLAPNQQAKINQAAEYSRQRQQQEELAYQRQFAPQEMHAPSNRNSVFTLGTVMREEASPAMQWARQYDKDEIRAQYLGNDLAGRGEFLTLPPNGLGANRSTSTLASEAQAPKELPVPPQPQMRFHTPPPVAPVEMPAMPIERPPPPPPAPVPVVEEVPEAAEQSEVHEPAALPVPPMPFAQEGEPTPESEFGPEESDVAEAVPQPTNPSPVEPIQARPITPQAGRPRQTSKATDRSVEPPSAAIVASTNAGRQSHDTGRKSAQTSSPERHRLKKNPHGPPPAGQKVSGIRRLFGTKRSKSRERTVPEKPTPAPKSPVEKNPAIAAARLALEGKVSPNSNSNSSPPLTPAHFAKMRNVAAVHTTITEPTNAVKSREVLRETLDQPERGQEERPHHAPPRTRRDDEFDQLSRVDTNEREDADHEFSKFDQGPLVDQPAFVPTDDPAREEFFTPGEEEPPHSVEPAPHPAYPSIYSAVTMQRDPVEEEEEDQDEDEITDQVSPQDRWAQIRRNAAERAASKQSTDQTRSRAETRTSDGETSGEETIESRVARIKARVAELTGNMDATRR